MNPLEVAEKQLDAYNAQDMEAMLATYAEDCVIAIYGGAVQQRGRSEVRARYTKTFADFPKNRARLVNRVAFGNVVIDHEQVERSPEGPFLEAVVIYTIENGQIVRAEFVSAG